MVKKIFAVLCVFMISVIPVYASPDNVCGYNIPVDIKINGVNLKTPVNSFLENGTVYVPVRSLCEALGAVVLWEEESNIATVSKGDIVLKFSETDNTLNYAQLYNDCLCTPVRIIAEAFGFTAEWDNKLYNVLIDAEGISVPDANIDYNAYSDEDIILLAKLIYAEAGYCSFDEMLGIGGVVMNRIRSPYYPSTVSGVIYDTKWSVQFPPAFDGSLNAEPSGVAVIAAKSAMHGVNTVGGSIGFGDASDTSSWIVQNMKCVCTYGSISFYE